jgi:hypothetical protein
MLMIQSFKKNCTLGHLKPSFAKQAGCLSIGNGQLTENFDKNLKKKIHFILLRKSGYRVETRQKTKNMEKWHP